MTVTRVSRTKQSSLSDYTGGIPQRCDWENEHSAVTAMVLQPLHQQRWGSSGNNSVEITVRTA